MHWAFTLETVIPDLRHEMVFPLCTFAHLGTKIYIWQLQLLINVVVLLLEVTKEEC